MSGHHWGAERGILIRFYTAVIRSKLDYGSMFYETAAHSHIDKLNKIQSKCLRIALGARTTSPVISLEAESHIPPLNIHIMLVLLKYYCRVCEMPNNIPLTKDLFKLQE